MDSSFFSSEFMPHGHCYLWKPEILWLHVVSDALIACSYYSIPIALTTLVRRRPDLAFSWVFVLFGVFIFACGTNHLIDIWTTWSARYGIEGIAKAFTASVSVATAIALWPLLPRAVALPSPGQLTDANDSLRAEIQVRRSVEEELRELNIQLDERVRIRTAQLEEQAAELERSNRDLEEFAYVVSHDLKGPLRGIANISDWLHDDHAGSLGDDGRGQLDLLRDRVSRLYTLIDGVLEYSRAGGHPVLESVDLGELCETVVSSLEVPPDVGIEIAADLPTIRFDRAQLTQVLLNLVGNAVRHIGGPGRVVITASEEDGDVEVCVADDGPGIAPEHRERIFRMFQTLDTENSATGIGLAIVKKIVERRGGRILVEGREGGGSVFRFSAPPMDLA